MAERNTSPAPASFPPPPNRACNRCRRRKIRCERTLPCSNCQSAGLECTISRRVVREKRKRVLISTEYETKINHIEETLTRLTSCVDKLQTGGLTSTMPTGGVAPTHISSPSSSASDLRIVPVIKRNTATANSAKNVAEPGAAVEGQSAFSAHCEFAIGFLQNFASSQQAAGDSTEITTLLDTLRNNLNAFHLQRLSPKLLFPFAKSGDLGGNDGRSMPPLESAFAVLHKAQAETNLTYLAFSYVLSPRSVSDLCLKIYFSEKYSDAEFIIINAVLLFLHGGSSEVSRHDPGDEQFAMMCRTNLETVLSGLSLYVRASYDMVFALILGAIYALDTSNSTLAWTLVSAAAQCAHTLGLQTPAPFADSSLPSQAQGLVLFWTVYLLEKSLCLRLGRSSTIPDFHITAPWPEELQTHRSRPLEYFNKQVKLAGLAGSIFDDLYSGKALQLSGQARTTQALKLAELLDRYGAEAREANGLWSQSTTDNQVKKQLRFISASDEITRLAMLTLVHRAMPVARNSPTTFNKDCLFFARSALDSHREFISELGAEQSSLISVYVNWTILFTPFFPFIVLFCHTIETGDQDDLNRMQTFVTSLQNASSHNSGSDHSAIAKHHRLFQVFHVVAARYAELTMHSTSLPIQEEQCRLKSQADAHLTALGLQPNMPATLGTTGIVANGCPKTPSEAVVMGGLEVRIPPGRDQNVQPPPQIQPSAALDWTRAQDGLMLGNWFSFNQQMMGFMDQSDFPF